MRTIFVRVLSEIEPRYLAAMAEQATGSTIYEIKEIPLVEPDDKLEFKVGDVVRVRNMKLRNVDSSNDIAYRQVAVAKVAVEEAK